jgi:hypothetical protein
MDYCLLFLVLFKLNEERNKMFCNSILHLQ